MLVLVNRLCSLTVRNVDCAGNILHSFQRTLIYLHKKFATIILMVLLFRVSQYFYVTFAVTKVSKWEVFQLVPSVHKRTPWPCKFLWIKTIHHKTQMEPFDCLADFLDSVFLPELVSLWYYSGSLTAILVLTCRLRRQCQSVLGQRMSYAALS